MEESHKAAVELVPGIAAIVVAVLVTDTMIPTRLGPHHVILYFIISGITFGTTITLFLEDETPRRMQFLLASRRTRSPPPPSQGSRGSLVGVRVDCERGGTATRSGSGRPLWGSKKQ